MKKVLFLFVCLSVSGFIFSEDTIPFDMCILAEPVQNNTTTIVTTNNSIENMETPVVSNFSNSGNSQITDKRNEQQQNIAIVPEPVPYAKTSGKRSGTINHQENNYDSEKTASSVQPGYYVSDSLNSTNKDIMVVPYTNYSATTQSAQPKQQEQDAANRIVQVPDNDKVNVQVVSAIDSLNANLRRLNANSGSDTPVVNNQFFQLPANLQQGSSPQTNARILAAIDSLNAAINANVYAQTNNEGSLRRQNEGPPTNIIGGNIIIGNNNTIIVLSDKDDLDRYFGKDKDQKKTSKTYSDKNDDRYPGEDDVEGFKEKLNRGFMSQWSLGLKASTLGLGFELATTLSDNFTLRAGYNYLCYNSKYYKVKVIDEDIRNAVIGNYNPYYRAKVNLKNNLGNALIDWHPTKGIFRFTAGVYFGQMTAGTRNGALVDGNNQNVVFDPAAIAAGLPKLNMGDFELTIQPDGRVNFDMEYDNFVKPYVGIGLGRTIPNANLGFSFDLGILFSGDYTVYQNGQKARKADDLPESFKNGDDFIKWFKCLPTAKVQVVYRF